MERPQIPDTKAYERITGIFKNHKNGITFSDVAAGTGLPLEKVKTLVPLAADEFSARLEVTESGDILYSFPGGFRSRYRGPGPALKRFLVSFARFAADALKVVFKAWIMVMLIGYFVLFMLIALASLFISISASNSNNRRDGRGGWNFSAGIFSMIIRLWFYSELFGGGARRYGSPARTGGWGANIGQKTGKGRPLHRAIFTFVFGEDDPNKDRLTLEKKEFIFYLRKRRGVVSLPELMTLTGRRPEEAESFMASLCAEFSGSPEVTEEGTVVYRFEEILLSGEKKEQEDSSAASGGRAAAVTGLPSLLRKRLKVFSLNSKSMNSWFGIINGVNLFFGTYFLYNAAAVGPILTQTGFQATGIYGFVYYVLSRAGFQALPIISIALGLTPLLFSAFFWLIPAIRFWLLKRENEALRTDNFRGLFVGRIWADPEQFRLTDVDPPEKECRPRHLAAVREKLLREMGSYSVPEVSVDEKQHESFAFPELRREKDALEHYRQSIDASRSAPGQTVFDTSR